MMLVFSCFLRSGPFHLLVSQGQPRLAQDTLMSMATTPREETRCAQSNDGIQEMFYDFVMIKSTSTKNTQVKCHVGCFMFFSTQSILKIDNF